MPGINTFGMPQLGIYTGAEKLAVDTNLGAGAANPQAATITLAQLSALISYLGNNLSKTPVAGTRYYTSVQVDTATLITGIAALIGATGGTDSFIFELHDSTGALVATTATAGVTVSTAATWQRIPFTAQYLAQPGTYYIVVQLNGTTARFAAYNSPTSPMLTGSAAGTFGTGAAITPPTSYTAGVGPVATLY